MTSAVKRSAVTRSAAVVAAACWSLTVCWMHTVMIVAAVSEDAEGQLFVFS